MKSPLYYNFCEIFLQNHEVNAPRNLIGSHLQEANQILEVVKSGLKSWFRMFAWDYYGDFDFDYCHLKRKIVPINANI